MLDKRKKVFIINDYGVNFNLALTYDGSIDRWVEVNAENEMVQAYTEEEVLKLLQGGNK